MGNETGCLRGKNPGEVGWSDVIIPVIRGNLGSKMGLIRKRTNNKFCELEFKNQQNFNKMSQP